MPDAHTQRMVHDGVCAPAVRRLAFEQASQSERYDGVTGFGLMLADIVGRAHGGGVNLPEVASGFAVEMRLPGTIALTTTNP